MYPSVTIASGQAGLVAVKHVVVYSIEVDQLSAPPVSHVKKLKKRSSAAQLASLMTQRNSTIKANRMRMSHF